MIKVVVFDLDDTLCPEIEYVKSGFRAVATQFGDKSLYKKLWRLFEKDHNSVYQRAGLSESETASAIKTYRNHKPELRLKRKVARTLGKLQARGYRIGIITDGRPEGQRGKLSALGLDKIADHIIVTDELGGVEFRKPNPTAFSKMRDFFQCEFCEIIYIGDNPKKDFIAPQALGIKTCFLLNKRGLYSSAAEADTDYHIHRISDVLKFLVGGKD